MSSESGFMGALRLVALGLGTAAVIVLLPRAYDATWPSILRLLSWYGPSFYNWAPFVWGAILAVLIYAATRAFITLAAALLGVLLAAILILLKGRK